MRMRIPYMAWGPGQLTVPGGAMVFLFGEENRDGMATVIFDGQVRKDAQFKTVFLNNFEPHPPISLDGSTNLFGNFQK